VPRNNNGDSVCTARNPRTAIAIDQAKDKLTTADLHGAWFPRLTDWSLHLSELDEVLLGAFDDSWRPTYELLLLDAG